MITANTVADYFLALANEIEELITNLKLNKLAYYTQAWHLALFKEPMFEDKIEAWVHGPVLPVVYDTYRHFKWAPIIRHDLKLEEIRQQFSTEQQELLDDIVEIYLPKTAYELEQLTRDEDPWVIARDGLEPDKASHNVITHDAMQKYFAELLKQGNIDDTSHIA
ncbi:MAG TPA: type II toxin-antitoxin system antitoxin SocA domain-containing protein [Ktedonobacteraceae bacterium]|nr:type II toxin-antitoxin system antitoxin SocA domain-containing protein [Ktedonobacteraceae bacterium]